MDWATLWSQVNTVIGCEQNKTLNCFIGEYKHSYFNVCYYYWLSPNCWYIYVHLLTTVLLAHFCFKPFEVVFLLKQLDFKKLTGLEGLPAQVTKEISNTANCRVMQLQILSACVYSSQWLLLMVHNSLILFLLVTWRNFYYPNSCVIV